MSLLKQGGSTAGWSHLQLLTPDSESFEARREYCRVITLAAFLFTVVLDYVLRISLDNNNNKEHGLLLKSRQSSRHPAQHLTDLNFADDLALISQSIKDAESLLQSLKAAATQRLHCNEGKTEFITTFPRPFDLKSLNVSTIKRLEDFKYLGSHIMDSEMDFNIHKALA